VYVINPVALSLDINECAGNGHGCQEQCENFLGGYQCTCPIGYRLNANDHKTCDGICMM
jgi:hypothetical protein